MKLRPYQRECIEAIEEYWDEYPLKNCGVSLPTGAGKTVIMSALASRAVERGERVAIIVDRDELVNQTLDKLKAADPLMFVGVVKASRDETAAEVVVCSIQTLRRPGRAERILPRNLVIYDEAHGSAADSSVDVMDRLGTIGGPTKAVGFSATFYRADGKPLDVIWDDIVFERSILWAVSEGYLSDARGISVPIAGLNLSEVKRSGGDYQDKDLAQKMLDAHGAEQIADAYVEVAKGRRTICFAPTVASAQAISAALRERGITSETVTGSTAAGERAAMYERLASGATEVLCSVAVLTTGFDSPSVDCVLMARPTESQGLYVQCVGRGLRPFPGKDYCLILDVSGTADDQSLVGVPRLAGKKKSADGESLRDMAGDAPPETSPRGLRANLRERGEFDPLARRRLAWLKTPGKGIDFVAVKGHAFVFLAPVGNGLFRIGRVDSRLAPDGTRAGKWLHADPVPHEFAAPLAEAFANEIGVWETAAELKRSTNPPSVAQVGYASSLGIEGGSMMTRGELTKAISCQLAASVLD